jgi:hypothetical protein
MRKIFSCLCYLFQCKKIQTRKIKPEKKYILPNSESFTVQHQEKHTNPQETETETETETELSMNSFTYDKKYNHIPVGVMMRTNKILSPNNSIDRYDVMRHNTITPVSTIHLNNSGKYSNTIEEYILNSNSNSFYIYD